MARYQPLLQHPSKQSIDDLTPDFAEIERILGASLPPSASKYPAWWVNERAGRSVHARSWSDAGFRTPAVDLSARHITFRRSR